jgi:hypothetical protein
LYRQGKELLEKLKSKREERPDGCTFTPKVTKSARACSTPNGDSRFDRLFSDGKKIAKKKEDSREATATKGCTFKPKISNKSKKLNNNKSKGQDRLNNLYRDAEKTRSKLKQRRESSATEG